MKNPHAQALTRLRNLKLSADRRKEIAKIANKASHEAKRLKKLSKLNNEIQA